MRTFVQIARASGTLWVVALAACADTRRPGTESTHSAPAEAAEITVTRLEPGRWRADYALAAPMQRLRFVREGSAIDRSAWKPADTAFRIVSDGLTDHIERNDGRLFASVSLALRSDHARLEREYSLTSPFTDGSEALFTGVFYAQGSTDGVPLKVMNTIRVVPAPGERVMVRGVASDTAVTWRDGSAAGTYALFGTMPLHESNAIRLVVDPGLPHELRSAAESLLPRLYEYYERGFGYELKQRPLVMIAWAPGSRDELAGHGDVLPGLVRLTFVGRGWQSDSPDVRYQAFHLIAHEMAHLWNGDRFVPAEGRGAPWMHEGGADALALLAMREHGLLDDASLRQAIESALNECLFETRGRSWSGAMTTSRVPYACGTTINMIVHAAMGDRGLTTFWRELFRSAEFPAARYDAALYMRTVARLTNDRVSGVIRSLLEDPASNDANWLSGALQPLGITLRVGEQVMGRRTAHLLARQGMTAVMQADCVGRSSFVGDGEGFRLASIPECRTLPFEGATVVAVEGRSVTADPAGVYQAVALRCAAGEPVEVNLKGPVVPLRITCRERLPEYVSVERW